MLVCYGYNCAELIWKIKDHADTSDVFMQDCLVSIKQQKDSYCLTDENWWKILITI